MARDIDRARHIKVAIGKLRGILSGKNYERVRSDDALWPALERYLQVISEAARALPPAWTAEVEHIPWRRIADIGNRLRHAYDTLQGDILWSIYENDLDPLEAAIDAMLAAHGSDEP
jgi:uncharacterized protein with HEPN domain